MTIGIGGLAPAVSAQNSPTSSRNLPNYSPGGFQGNYQKALLKAQRHGWPLRLNLSPGKAISLHHTDALGQPVYYTTHSTPLSLGTHTASLYEGGGLGLKLSGSSPSLKGKLALWDGGKVRSDHRELSGKVIQSDVDGPTANDHATHMAGILVGRGIYKSAQGMAFGGELSAWDFDNDLSEVVREAPNLLISNHAYGPVAGWVLDPSRPGNSNDLKWEWWGTPAVDEQQDFRFGFYDEAVSEVDRITYNFPYFLMVRSADNKRVENGPPAGTKYFLKNTDNQSALARSRNDGYDILPGESNAKNVLTVGAAELSDTAYRVTPYSSWGPTDDGRIKPDLLGLGMGVISSMGTSTDAYGTFSGTSMASANVSGSLLLLQELYQQRKGVFMLSSTLKGLVLHTATKPGANTAPSYEYGWGLLDAEKAAKVILNENGESLLAENVLTQGGTYTRSFVASGDRPLVITICWTDPEAVPTPVSSRNLNNPTPKLVNDLDAMLTEGFNRYEPWVLDPAAPAEKAKRGDNFRDNVEQIFVAQPLKGRTYSLTVSHKNILKNGRQPYALVVSGQEQPDCALAATLTPGNDTTLCAGQAITLSANPGLGFTYEWSQNGTMVKKGVERTLEVNKPGRYAVRVSSAGCEASSRLVEIRGSDLFADIAQKGTVLVCDDKGTELQANTGAGYNYQWLVDGKAVGRATSSRYQAIATGSYQVRISHSSCVATSTATRVDIKPVKSTLTPSVSAVICNDLPARLAAPQEKEYVYAWYHNGTLIPTATDFSYQASKAGRYSVEVGNGTCRVRSTDVIVQQVKVNAVITQPASTVIDKGGSVALQANYEIGNRYAWYREDSLLAAEDAPLLKVTEGGRYKVVVSNGGCTAESAVVTLLGGTSEVGSPYLVTGLTPTIAADDALLLYPNPSHEVVTVTIPAQGRASNSRATLIGLAGRPVLSQSLIPEGGYLKTKFDLRHLPAGFYLIKVSAGERIFTKSFLKQ
ncbi:S8 family serine peptidase [Persicitalea sp.]|uniref:S8 family serine peptidase n=1 Tax=Persicitalea sp. TaxID=3100273 RepID=UPI00359429DF